MRTERIVGLVLLTDCNYITGTFAYAVFHVLADGLDVTLRTRAASGNTLIKGGGGVGCKTTLCSTILIRIICVLTIKERAV